MSVCPSLALPPLAAARWHSCWLLQLAVLLLVLFAGWLGTGVSHAHGVSPRSAWLEEEYGDRTRSLEMGTLSLDSSALSSVQVLLRSTSEYNFPATLTRWLRPALMDRLSVLTKGHCTIGPVPFSLRMHNISTYVLEKCPGFLF